MGCLPLGVRMGRLLVSEPVSPVDCRVSRGFGPGDRIVTAMSAGLPAPPVPVTTVAQVIARMETVEAALPAGDGLACFNRMYLGVTRQVYSRLGQGFYADPAFMTQLDVVFASLYFGVADAAGNPAAVPLAWLPLVEQRANAGIEPVQFALAGMNAHINLDLPVAVVSTCTALATSPMPVRISPTTRKW